MYSSGAIAKVLAVVNPPAAPPSPAYSTIKWTCRFCNTAFSRRSRKGLRLSCPHCGRVQEGPEGIKRLVSELEHKQASKRRPKAPAEQRTPAVNGARPGGEQVPAEIVRSAPKTRSQKPREAQPKRTPVHPPAVSSDAVSNTPPPPRRSVFGRFLSGEWEAGSL